MIQPNDEEPLPGESAKGPNPAPERYYQLLKAILNGAFGAAIGICWAISFTAACLLRGSLDGGSSSSWAKLFAGYTSEVSADLLVCFLSWGLLFVLYRSLGKKFAGAVWDRSVCLFCNRETLDYWPAGKDRRKAFERLFEIHFCGEYYYFVGISADHSVDRLLERFKSSSERRPTRSFFIIANPWDDASLRPGYLFANESRSGAGVKYDHELDYLQTKRHEICNALWKLRSLHGKGVFHVYLCAHPVYSRMEIVETGLFVENYDSQFAKWGNRYFLSSRTKEYAFRKAIATSLIKEAEQCPHSDPTTLKGTMEYFSHDSAPDDILKLMQNFPDCCGNFDTSTFKCINKRKGEVDCWLRTQPSA